MNFPYVPNEKECFIRYMIKRYKLNGKERKTIRRAINHSPKLSNPLALSYLVRSIPKLWINQSNLPKEYKRFFFHHYINILKIYPEKFHHAIKKSFHNQNNINQNNIPLNSQIKLKLNQCQTIGQLREEIHKYTILQNKHKIKLLKLSRNILQSTDLIDIETIVYQFLHELSSIFSDPILEKLIPYLLWPDGL